MPSPARPRHVAFSGKQKKQQLQVKRALKRGDDIEPTAVGINGRARLDKREHARSQSQGGLELHSRFLAVPRDYVTRTRDAAWNDTVTRPLPDYVAVFPQAELVDHPAARSLCVPTRPPFFEGQSKGDVEANERLVFQEWLDRTRATMEAWVDDGSHSPSSFETNLEVWRQL